MLKKLIITTAILPLLAGCATTDIVKTAQMVKKARTAEKIVSGTKDMIAPKQQAQTASATKVANLRTATPINSIPMAVTMKKTNGKTKTLKMQPNIAIAGYNVGAFTDAKVTGKASGDLLGYSQGSRTTIKLVANGIDAAMLQRVADAAHNDLVAQLTAAGISVIPANKVAATPSAGKLGFSKTPYSGTVKVERGKKTILVAGPTATGVRSYMIPGKRTYRGTEIVKPSSELNAVMLMPNLVLDFAALKANNAKFTTRSKASSKVRFAIDPSSAMDLQVSKGRFLDGWLSYGMKGDAISDADFAVLGKAQKKSNKLEQGLGLALGMATAAKKTSSSTVTIDPVRYEALALKAAKGWNAAFVTQLKAARVK